MRKNAFNVFKVFFCFFLVALFCSCSIFDEPKEIDSSDFNLPIVSNEYDLLFLSSMKDKEEEFNKLFYEYELETGVKIRNFSAENSQVYTDLLKTQMSSNNKPSIFLIRDEFEFNFCEKEGCLLNLSSSNRQGVKDLLSHLDKKLRPNFNLGDVLCIPCFLDSYGYLVDTRVLKDLIFETNTELFLEDFRSCSFLEFESFIKILSDYIKHPKKISFKLNKNTYSLKEKKTGNASNIKNIFSPKINFDNSLDTAFYSSFKDPESLKAVSGKTSSLKSSLVSYAKLLNLEMQNSSGTLLGNKNKEQNLESFIKKECLLMQGGTDDFKALEKNSPEFKDCLRLLPVKTPYSVNEKTNTFFPVFSTNYIVINSKLEEKEKKMSEDFLIWFINSDKSKKIIYSDMKKIPLNSEKEEKNNIFFNFIIKQKNLDNIFASSSYKYSDTYNELFDDLKEYFQKQNPTEKDYKDFADKTIKAIRGIKQ